MINGIHHIQIAVARDKEAETIRFYKDILGLIEIPKPENLRKNGGAWFEVGPQQFHIAPEDVPVEYNSQSKRHPCFLVSDLDTATAHLTLHNIELIPDNQPIPGWKRIYFRDPAGNRVELAEMLNIAGL